MKSFALDVSPLNPIRLVKAQCPALKGLTVQTKTRIQDGKELFIACSLQHNGCPIYGKYANAPDLLLIANKLERNLCLIGKMVNQK